MKKYLINSKSRLFFKNHPLVFGIFLLLFLLQHPLAEGKEKIHSKIIVQPTFELSPEEFETVSFSAGQILRHVFLAREAISEGKKGEAQKQIAKGLLLVALIEKVVPLYKITAVIRSGDIVYHNEDLVIQTFVPIYDELHHVDILNSVIQAQRNPQSNASDDSIGAYTHYSKSRFLINKLSDPHTRIITYSGFNHTTVKLNIEMAKDSMTVAKKEIVKGRMKEADVALLNLQRVGVILEFTESDLPLADAADLLKQGERAIMQGQIETAKNALKAAAVELKRYQTVTGKQNSKEVLQLYQEINQWMQVAEKPNVFDRTLGDTQKKVKSWWRRVVNMLE